MTAEEIKIWIGIISGVVALIVSGVSYLRQPSKDNSAKLDDHTDELQGLERRVDRVETQLEHVPSKDDFTSLQLSLSDLRGTVSTTEEIVKTVRRTTQNIDDWLRSNGGKA
ncbi:DUF2730 family protein [uncultured Cohaesibacter sp.]|uniref:DUF2730 family protein n=1 Tax=uncultured Cohaesibacter sp. TaxID=1002546 RepID=UPI002AAB90DE|nr:DUF2730 family protein [uncultured Cohaesibacter sp.]